MDCAFGDACLSKRDHALGWNHSIVGGFSIIVKYYSNELHKADDIVGSLLQKDATDGHLATDSAELVG
jgi:hypothetical protein